jgi:hypothetical protein
LKKYCLFYFRFSQSQISVRLGEYDFTTQGETGEQTYTLSGMKMHENYDPKTFENDIAILKLSQDAQFTQSVQPACLPIGDSDYNNVKVKFVFSKKATKIDKIFTVDLTLYYINIKSMVKSWSFFVAFLENMNFKY